MQGSDQYFLLQTARAVLEPGARRGEIGWERRGERERERGRERERDRLSDNVFNSVMSVA